MGCVQAKSSTYSPPQGIERLKLEAAYRKGDNGEIHINHKQLGKLQAPRFILEDKHIVGVVTTSGGGGGGGGGEKAVASEAERERSGGSRNVSKKVNVQKKIGEDELVDGWPKWLVDNVPSHLLEGLVPKSADSYDKLAKASVDIT